MLARFVIPALLAASLMAPARAEDPEHTVIVVVDRASHALLKHRIAVAVEEVCRSYATVEAYQWPEIDACRKVAWASASRQLAALSGTGEIRLSSR
jgi:hypothetical protein